MCPSLTGEKYFRIKSYPITGLDWPVGLQEVEAHRISRQLAHESGKIVSLMHRPPLPAGDIPGTLLLEAELTPGP
jgi:hypothetical protein